MVKAGVTTSINTKHQCITAMKEYENKSLEVRLEAELWSALIGSYMILYPISQFCSVPQLKLD